MFNDIFLIFTMDTPLKASEISKSANSKRNRYLKNIKISKLQKEQIFKKYQNQSILGN